MHCNGLIPVNYIQVRTTSLTLKQLRQSLVGTLFGTLFPAIPFPC